MADRRPLKILPDSASGNGGGDSTGLGEFLSGDTVGIVDGGTGADSASGARTSLGVSPTAGSSSITTLGTIATGTWEATDIAVAHGGTGASTFTANGILLGNGTSAVAASAAMTTDGTLLIGGTGGPEVATLTAGSNITLTNGDGSITIAAAAGGVDAANGVEYRVATFSDSDSLNGESGLTFNGSVLAVTGAVTMADAAGPTIVNEAATATNPTLIPNKAEVDTGLGWAAADTLTLITGGSERVRVDASGRVGIGNSDISTYTGDTSTLVVGDTGDAGASIKIAGSTSATQRYAFTDTADTTDQAYVSYNHGTGMMALATEGSDKVTISSGGNLGVGTSSAEGHLHVSAASGVGTMLMEQTGNNGTNPVFTFKKNRGSGNSATGIAGMTQWQGLNSANNLTTFAQMRGSMGTVTSGAEDGDIQFWTVGGATLSERMRINHLGEVGINTTGIGYQFMVKAGSSGGTTNSVIWAQQTSAGATAYQAHINNGSYTGIAYTGQVETQQNANYNHIRVGDGWGNTSFRAQGNGAIYGASFNTSGADYQEFFESTDGSALEFGKSVVLDGDKVRLYDASTDSTDSILGVVRPKSDAKSAAVVGNTAESGWTDKYLTDDWGVYLKEDITVWNWETIDAVEASDGVEAVEFRDAGTCHERDALEKDPSWTPPSGAVSEVQSVYKRNPSFDASKTYVPREKRDEWNVIGLLGQVQIKADEPTRPGWIKMKQISDTVDLWLVR